MYCIQYTYAHTHTYNCRHEHTLKIEFLRVIFILACSNAHHFQRCCCCCCCCSLNRAISVCCSSQLHSVFVNVVIFTRFVRFPFFLCRLSTVDLSVRLYLALAFQMDCFRQESYRIEINMYFSLRFLLIFFSSN